MHDRVNEHTLIEIKNVESIANDGYVLREEQDLFECCYLFVFVLYGTVCWGLLHYEHLLAWAFEPDQQTWFAMQHLVNSSDFCAVELGQRWDGTHVAEHRLSLDLPHSQSRKQIQCLFAWTSSNGRRRDAEFSNLVLAIDKLVHLVWDDLFDGVVVVVVGREFGLPRVEDIQQRFGVKQDVTVLMPSCALDAGILLSHWFYALADKTCSIHQTAI